jgi:hypothetical protein
MIGDGKVYDVPPEDHILYLSLGRPGSDGHDNDRDYFDIEHKYNCRVRPPPDPVDLFLDLIGILANSPFEGKSFFNNRRIIYDSRQDSYVAWNWVTQKIVGFFTLSRDVHAILLIQSFVPRAGLGRYMLSYIEANIFPGQKLGAEHPMETSIPFWQKMGFKASDEEDDLYSHIWRKESHENIDI